MNSTHEVFNQPAPLVDANLFAGNRPLRDALAALMPALDTTSLHAAGAEFGSAAVQTHARLANQHPPLLHTHSRVGRRIDEVEFHPSYHALAGHGAAPRPARHTVVGRPGRTCAARGGFHAVHRSRSPACLCPVSMSYAVTPALRGHAALHAALGAKLANTAYDARFVPIAQKATLTMGMGMTEKQGGSDVRANTTRAVFDGEDGWGRRYAVDRPQVVFLGADVRCLPGAGADHRRALVLFPAALAALMAN